jgi:hypothetical protein
MEGGKDKGNKEEEPLDPIMMDDDQINWILASMGNTHSGSSYQYKVNTRKTTIVVREGLVSDEEEVEDLMAMEQIKEVLHATYERKTRGEENHPIHINVSVEPINPCTTNTPKRTPPFRQPQFRESMTVESTYTQGKKIRGAS